MGSTAGPRCQGDAKTLYIQVRVSPAERAGLERLARRLGVNMSEALRLFVKAMDSGAGAQLDGWNLGFEDATSASDVVPTGTRQVDNDGRQQE